MFRHKSRPTKITLSDKGKRQKLSHHDVSMLLLQTTAGSLAEGAAAAANSSEKKKSLADVIDLSGAARDGLTINRKRKAALEQGNILKKIKKRTYQ